MATTTSPIVTAPAVPAVPGLPIVGSLLEFRRDRLALHDRAAALGSLARLQIVHIPLYAATCADLAHQVLVAQADGFRKSAGIRYLMPILGDGLLTSDGETHRRHR